MTAPPKYVPLSKEEIDYLEKIGLADRVIIKKVVGRNNNVYISKKNRRRNIPRG